MKDLYPGTLARKKRLTVCNSSCRNVIIITRCWISQAYIIEMCARNQPIEMFATHTLCLLVGAIARLSSSLTASWVPLLDIGLPQFLPLISVLCSVGPVCSCIPSYIVNPTHLGLPRLLLPDGFQSRMLPYQFSFASALATCPAQLYLELLILCSTSGSLVSSLIEAFVCYSFHRTPNIFLSICNCADLILLSSFLVMIQVSEAYIMVGTIH